ncbi:hypothetical protein F4859DRAFT_279405 [Xylaria cf. heliscus]|nr:hypothetical protein F4859DRAFT_279405 [Xylaria cf. heliscus]
MGQSRQYRETKLRWWLDPFRFPSPAVICLAAGLAEPSGERSQDSQIHSQIFDFSNAHGLFCISSLCGVSRIHHASIQDFTPPTTRRINTTHCTQELELPTLAKKSDCNTKNVNDQRELNSTSRERSDCLGVSGHVGPCQAKMTYLCPTSYVSRSRRYDRA